jgi:hypothetical protein
VSINDDFEALGVEGVRTRLIEGSYGAPHNPNFASAKEWLLSQELIKSEKRAEENMSLILEKLQSIERPHWTMVPVFWVALVAAIAALFAVPQVQQFFQQDAPAQPVQTTIHQQLKSEQPPPKLPIQK